jgi:hypothetical protein
MEFPRKSVDFRNMSSYFAEEGVRFLIVGSLANSLRSLALR